MNINLLIKMNSYYSNILKEYIMDNAKRKEIEGFCKLHKISFREFYMLYFTEEYILVDTQIGDAALHFLKTLHNRSPVSATPTNSGRPYPEIKVTRFEHIQRGFEKTSGGSSKPKNVNPSPMRRIESQRDLQEKDSTKEASEGTSNSRDSSKPNVIDNPNGSLLQGYRDLCIII
jgi:hypothetical protein